MPLDVSIWSAFVVSALIVIVSVIYTIWGDKSESKKNVKPVNEGVK